ncbi:MAG: lipocalin-like domain-containing protein [Steroidobacteraceae bacterium]
MAAGAVVPGSAGGIVASAVWNCAAVAAGDAGALAAVQRPTSAGKVADAGTAVQADRLSVLRAAPQSGFELAQTQRRFEFPQDHGPHPQFRHEWWYLTGQLRGADGAIFGFELTMFRLGLVPPAQSVPAPGSAWRARQMYAGAFRHHRCRSCPVFQRDALCA